MPFNLFRNKKSASANKKKPEKAEDGPPRRRRSSSTSFMNDGSSSRRKSRSQSYLQQIGGEAALEMFVEIFCERIVSEPYLMKFFRGVNVEQFKAHQLKFLRIALSPAEEDESSVDIPKHRQFIVDKHRRLFDMGLNESHFDHVMVHFSETCQDLEVKDKVIEDVYTNVLLPYRDIFVKLAW